MLQGRLSLNMEAQLSHHENFRSAFFKAEWTFSGCAETATTTSARFAEKASVTGNVKGELQHTRPKAN